MNFDHKKFLSILKNSFESNSKNIALFLGTVAVVIGLYNSYQIKNGGGHMAYVDSNTGVQTILSPEKIISEIPNGTQFIGDQRAKLTVVEFGDFQCPFCSRIIVIIII